MLADYFVVGKGKPENWHSVEGWNWAGVITWVISVVASYLLEIDYLGILFSAIIYLIIERFIPSQSRPGSVPVEGTAQGAGAALTDEEEAK